MLQDDESLALALRGGLRGRFQGTFNQLENAVEVLDDYMLQHLNPAEYADLRTMMREINWQLAYLRRLVTTPPMLPRPPYCRCCVCPPPWNC